MSKYLRICQVCGIERAFNKPNGRFCKVCKNNRARGEKIQRRKQIEENKRQRQIMRSEDQEIIKERIIKYRSEGAGKKDCADLAGISRNTIYDWLEKDQAFHTKFIEAWKIYMMSLIKNVKEKDSWKLLTSDFKERFQDKPDKQINIQGDLIQNVLNMSESQLDERLQQLKPEARGASHTGNAGDIEGK